MAILTQSNARAVWAQFKKKQDKLYQGENFPERYKKKLTEEQQLVFLKKQEERNISREQLEKSAITLQRFWAKKRGKDTLLDVNPSGYHSKGFEHFLRAQKTKKSIHQKKLDRLLQSINEGNWKDEIFQDKTIANLTLSLYAADKITYQQTCSILELVQLEADAVYYPILDIDGNFTKEAHEILLAKLRDHIFLKELSHGQLNDLKLLIATLPKSEQFFYITKTPKSRSDLGEELMSFGSILEIAYPGSGRSGERGDLHFTAGLRDAIGLAQFGLDEYVPTMPRLGKLTTTEIEEGVRHKVRYAAVYFPGVPEHPTIHGTKNYSHYEATHHDISHSDIMSTLPKKLLEAFHDMIDISRAVISKDLSKKSEESILSKEIWSWIDMSFTLTYRMNKILEIDLNDHQALTDLFCNILQMGSSEDIANSMGGYLLYAHADSPNHGKMSVLGVAVMLDIIQNPEKWKQKGIEPKYFTELFRRAFEELGILLPLLVDSNPKIQIFKGLIFQPLFQFFGESNADQFFSLAAPLNEIINANSDFIDQKLKFRKTKTNHIVFEYNGEPITPDTTTQLIKDLLKQKNPDVSNTKIAKWTEILCHFETDNPDYQRCLAMLLKPNRQQNILDV